MKSPMHRVALTALIGLLGAMHLAATPAHALFQTPNVDRGLVFSPLDWDGGNSGAMYEAEVALADQGYSVEAYDQTFWPGNGSTAEDIIGSLYGFGARRPYGALGMATHGWVGTGEPAIEFVQSQQDANDVIADLVTFGYLTSSTEAIVGYTMNYYGTFGTWIVTLSAAALQRLSQPSNAIIHVGACYGGYAYSSWTANGVAAMASYGATCGADIANGDARLFWQGLHGYSGRVLRNLGNATFNTDLIVSNGANTGLVLAPWTLDIQPLSGVEVSAPQSGYTTFDTTMRTSSSLLNAVTATNALGFWSSPSWSSSSRINYVLYPKAKGSGTLTIVGSNLFSSGGIQICTNSRRGPNEYKVYSCVPPTNAVSLREIGAESEPAGARIRFETAWEHASSSFQVERMDDPSNPSWVSAEVTAAGSGGGASYEILDGAGQAGSRYRLVEHQVGDLPDLRYGVFEAGPPPVIIPTEIPSYNVDSLAAVVRALDSSGEFGTEGSGSPALYLVFAPDSLADSLGSYESIWEARGVSTRIVSLSQAQSEGGIVPYLQSAYTQGTRYALLVGDANDAAWWDDPNRWTNGWNWPRVGGTGPHIPSQPGRNLIPTFYTADLDSPRIALSSYTPYYASDLPYADMDGDGLPDLRIGRLPVGSAAEVRAYTAKLSTYLQAPIPEQGLDAALLTYAQNNGLIRGDDVNADADALAASIPGAVNLTRHTDTESTLWSPAYRESLANDAANDAPDYILWMASGAQRDIYGNYWRLDQGWSMAKLSPVTPPNRFFMSLAFSCGMGNFDQTESYVWCDSTGWNPATCIGPITPIAERLLMDPQKGAIAIVGPSRGTIEDGNRIFALELKREILNSGRDVGTAFMMAQRYCIVNYPNYTDLFRSYNLLGDPLLGGPTVTAVASTPNVPHVGLGGPRPNPFNPTTSLTVTTASTGRVQLRIFDAHGRLVRTLIGNEVLPAGSTSVTWDGLSDQGAKSASGVYLVRMDVSGKTFRRKVVLLK